jgi:hypothetical protein
VVKYMMTGKQRRGAILAFIRRFRTEHDYAPSIAEIAAAVSAPKSAVHYHLGILQDEGRLTRKRGIPRSIVLTEPDAVHRCLICSEPIKPGRKMCCKCLRDGVLRHAADCGCVRLSKPWWDESEEGHVGCSET